ncbi:MAG: hypothetical protein V2A69_12365, partial [Pseudomonadota bacterium]
MKKVVLLLLLLFAFTSVSYAETEGDGFCAAALAAQTYPLLTWGEVRTITYDQDPGTHETTSKV